MIPALETRESVSVDLPWSTWAMTEMLRMFVAVRESEGEEQSGQSLRGGVCSSLRFVLTLVHETTDLVNGEENPAEMEEGVSEG